jgi:hypothetical protein
MDWNVEQVRVKTTEEGFIWIEQNDAVGDDSQGVRITHHQVAWLISALQQAEREVTGAPE